MSKIEKSLQPDNTLIIKGKATTNSLDLEQDQITITPNAFKDSLDEYYQGGAKMLVSHGRTYEFGDNPVGRTVYMKYNPEDWTMDKPIPESMWVDYIGVVTDPKAVQGCLDEVYIGLSVGLVVKSLGNNILAKQIIPNTNHAILTGVHINEVSICETPANTDCYFEIVDFDESNFLYNVNEEVEAYGQQGVIKALGFGKEKQPLYRVEYKNSYLKALVPEAQIIKMRKDALNACCAACANKLDKGVDGSNEGLAQINYKNDPAEYVVDKVYYKGLNIGITHKAGQKRFGKTLQDVSYGKVFNSIGEDGEFNDVYVKTNPAAHKSIYAIKQLKDSGEFDEYKYMVGFDSMNEAETCYKTYMPESKFGGIKQGRVSKLKRNKQ